MNIEKIKRSGSTFIAVVGILSVIIFSATSFMSSTIQEGKQTNLSIRGLHANSLAEAAIERAMSQLIKEINKIDLKSNVNLSSLEPKDFAITLRLPATEGSASLAKEYKVGSNLGDDKELVLCDAAKGEIEFSKEDLQGQYDDLDTLVEYMTNNSHSEYTVTVKAKILNAFRNSPGTEKPDYQIPGVDIPWNARRDVRSLLDGNGYTAWHFEFTDDMRWFELEIPIKILGFEVCSFDMVQIASNLLKPITDKFNDPDIQQGGIQKMTTLDWAAKKIMNDCISKIASRITGNDMGDLYPIDVKIAKGNMPTNINDLWPNGVSISQADGQYLEKYGQISFESEAKIKYKDGYTSSRRITAVKDFKVSDCEPPASMYSFFIANEDNEKIAFNNYGGDFYVNNVDFTNMSEDIKNFLKGNTLSEEKMNKREFPGLIRVNAKCDDPIYCNVGFLGNTGQKILTKTEDGEDKLEDASLPNILNGMDTVMLLKSKTDMTVANASYEVDVHKEEKEPGSDLYTTVVTGGGSVDGLDLRSAVNNVQSALGGKFGLNIIPKVGNMNTNIIRLAICLAVRPFTVLAKDKLDEAVDKSVLGDYGVSVGGGLNSIIDAMDCFETWEMPYMGTSNELFTFPNLGQGSNKTHLFGYSGMHPTLTKEIEGNVESQYRQWRMCIVGMYATDKIIICGIPVPPVPIPLWRSTTQSHKYGYEIKGFKSLDEDGSETEEVYTYDPAKPENKVPNLYTCEQYAKKATYYYENTEQFKKDIPNRLTEVNGKKALVLNGITYIADSLGSEEASFDLSDVEELNKDPKNLYVFGKGMIVVSGNVFLDCNIVAWEEKNADEKTVFSLICRKGGLIATQSGNYIIKGSLYTDQGIYVISGSSLHIVGNWVTNAFRKPKMMGTVVVDYASTRTRTSIGSLHPTRGKYDPNRYHVSFSPIWSSWRAF